MKKQAGDIEKTQNPSKKKITGKKIAFFALATSLVGLAFFLIFFFGIGTNSSINQEKGTTNSTLSQSVAESTQQSPDLSGSNEETVSSIPSELIVYIEETRVTIAGKSFENAAEFKAFLENIHNDNRTYRLEEKNAILSTHDWVTTVFEELAIPLAHT